MQNEDCISRQYLLDNCVVDKVTMPYVPVSKIENAPPVTPQQKISWIPVSEGLPKPRKYGIKDNSDWVDVTILIGKNKDAYVGEAYYCFSENKWYTKRFATGEVIAWQPRPKPYKAESEE